MSSKSTLPLDEQLCFALYSASLTMTQQYKSYLEPLGLTYPQYTILLILFRQNGLTLKKIGEQLGIKSGALTPVIKRMEAERLLTRTKDEQDERSLLIHLTSKGKNLEAELANITHCIVASTEKTQSELITLRQQLTDLKEKLTRQDLQ